MGSPMAALAPEEVILRGIGSCRKIAPLRRMPQSGASSGSSHRSLNASQIIGQLGRPFVETTRWSAVGPDVFTRPTCRAEDHGVSTPFHEMEPRPSIHTQPSNQALQATAPLRHPFDVALT